MKRAHFCFLAVAIICVTASFWPMQTTADSAVRVLDIKDTHQFDWVANGQYWFEPDEEIVPTRIIIERLNIDLKVTRGGLARNNKSWHITKRTVSFSSQLGNAKASAQSIFMYGHNTNQVLKPTENLKPGDILKIKLDSGPWVKYIYNYNEVVDPSDVKAVNSQKSNLILLACHGKDNEFRRIMHFSLQK